MGNFFKKLKKRLDRKRKKLFKTTEEKARRSKGEMPKCKTCEQFCYCYKANGKTMKMACIDYSRKQKHS